jgi:hypothetical protein
MEAMRESWTDRRLDEFAVDTARRFDQVDSRLDRVDARLDTLETCMKDGFARVDADIRELRVQTAAFQRTALQLFGGMVVTLVLGFTGILTQL